MSVKIQLFVLLIRSLYGCKLIIFSIFESFEYLGYVESLDSFESLGHVNILSLLGFGVF